MFVYVYACVIPRAMSSLIIINLIGWITVILREVNVCGCVEGVGGVCGVAVYVCVCVCMAICFNITILTMQLCLGIYQNLCSFQTLTHTCIYFIPVYL